MAGILMNELAMNNEILRGVVGSTAHGIAIEGTDDRDEMGIFIEPPVHVCGLHPMDHYVYRTQPEGVRSGPGDLDLTMYSLRKFMRMAVKGSPSIVLLMWLPEYIVNVEGYGSEIIALREKLISRDCGKCFLGYLVAQRKRMTGELSRNVNRPELVEKYGFDTKFASHALRLGYQGIELMSDGKLSLPLPPGTLATVRGVKTGMFSYAETLEMINEAERILEGLVDHCNLKADVDAANKVLVNLHRNWWGWK